MPADSPTPLATFAQMQGGPLADLVSGYTSAVAQSDLMVEATRVCEGIANRRLAPFTGLTETMRAEGIDPDETSAAANIPMDMAGSLGRSYADALGASDLVRHVWLAEHAPRYPEMWAYSAVSVTIVRSIGGSQAVGVGSLVGPEPDSGHLWFKLGTFLPVGSLVRVTYSGGYSTVPGDLVRAGKFMAASIACDELDPLEESRAPALRAKAEKLLKPYQRS